MNPTTPLAALESALAEVCPSTLWAQPVEAEALHDALGDLGFMVVPAVSLPTSAPRGEPTTAAARIENLSDRHYAVWWLLSFAGPLTDEELCDRYETFVDPDSLEMLPHQTPQSIRSRRKELERVGHVHRTGERRPTRNGGRAAVWRAGGNASEVAA